MRIFSFGFIVALAGSFALAQIPALHAAESACKGLHNANCKQNESCSWVKSYKIKSGKEVSGFCRKKASRKSTAKTTG